MGYIGLCVLFFVFVNEILTETKENIQVPWHRPLELVLLHTRLYTSFFIIELRRLYVVGAFSNRMVTTSVAQDFFANILCFYNCIYRRGE
jgi:hypothetical protein